MKSKPELIAQLENLTQFLELLDNWLASQSVQESQVQMKSTVLAILKTHIKQTKELLAK